MTGCFTVLFGDGSGSGACFDVESKAGNTLHIGGRFQHPLFNGVPVQMYQRSLQLIEPRFSLSNLKRSALLLRKVLLKLCG